MSDILSIGAGATQLYRQSLATVSNNIANLNTEGYSRQVATSAEGGEFVMRLVRNHKAQQI